MTRSSELETELEDTLKICCGPTSDVLLHMLKTLQILKRRWDAIGGQGKTKDDAVYEKTYTEMDEHLGLIARPEVGYVYLYLLNSLDLIEHGTGIRGSWPTKAGLDILVKLEAWAAERSLKETR